MKKTRKIAAWIVSGLLLGMTPIWAADEGARASSPVPPKNLKLVGDHWTPWEPPTPGPNDYIIQRGDTLWDLAGKWLGDPFLWPQVWDQNRYVLDSHWIYPGDPLVVPGQPTVVPPEGPPEGPAVSSAPGAPTGTKGKEAKSAKPVPAAPKLIPVADMSDLYCSGFIEPSHSTAEVRIVGREFEREMVATGDVVYVNQGQSQGVRAGDRLAVIRPESAVSHPASGDALGTYVRRLGSMRVLAAQENTATAVIEFGCDAMKEGDEIVPWVEIPAPRLTELPPMDQYDVTPSGGAVGYVVAARDSLQRVGEGNVIHVDLGDASGLGSGEILQLFRDNGDLPRLMLGRAVVLTVEPGTATAKVYQSVREIAVGDRVEVVR